MDLWKMLRIIVRHWRLVAAVLILTVAGIGGVASAVPPTYQASSTMLLLAPAGGAPATGTAAAPVTNPYLGFGSSLIVTAQVMTQAMNQPTVAEEMKRQGAQATFAVQPDGWGRSPTLTIVANDPNEGQALLTVRKVIDATRNELNSRQQDAGAPKGLWIAAQTVTAPQKAKVLHGAQVRAILAIGALGLGLSVILAAAAEGIGRRKKDVQTKLGRLARVPSDEPTLGADSAAVSAGSTGGNINLRRLHR